MFTTGPAARNSQRKQDEIRVKAPVFGLKPESHEEERTDPVLFAWQGPRCHFWVDQTNICFEEKRKSRKVDTTKVGIPTKLILNYVNFNCVKTHFNCGCGCH